MATTLLLDRDTWDLCVDAQGNIAVASEPYSQLQDVSSACRLFAGELWYDTTRGLPFLDAPPLQILRARLGQAALAVPGVVSAVVVTAGLTARTLRGQVQVTLGDGSVQTVVL